MVATASTVGAIGGTIVAGKLADAFGRRTTLLVTSCYSIIGSAFSAYASSFNYILIGRLISGLGIGHYSTIVPIYIAECAESKKRGTLSTVPQLMVTVDCTLIHTLLCSDVLICRSQRESRSPTFSQLCA
jgi:MFS family permease